MRQGIDQGRRHFVATAAAAVTGLELAMLGSLKNLLDDSRTPASGGLSALRGATAWLNSPPLTPAGLRGKVVLIDVWTYTCINWLRTLPYVRAWAEKYRTLGLVTIGVHTPEFSFEHELENVRRQAKAMNVEYPIAIDNEYAIWRGLDNHYWPALYLADAKGEIRHHQFGEGEYEQTEAVIQQLLAESGARGLGRDPVSVEGQGLEAPADWANLSTAETYLGHARGDRFALQVAADASHAYKAPERLRSNEWALDGSWTVRKEAVGADAPNGRILFRFHARDLHLVMGPAMRGTSPRFRVRIDGQAPGSAHGGDVDEQGNGIASEQRLYQLIRQPKPIDDRRFEIEFLDPGVEAFAFTFG